MFSKLFSNIGILIILLLNFSGADENEHNYDIFFDKMEMKKGGDILAADFKVEKTGPAHFNVNGFVENFKEFSDDWRMELQFFKSNSTDGEYHYIMKYPLKGPKGICLFLKNEYKKHFYESLKDYSNAPHYDTCPLMPTKYTITNYPFDAGIFKKFLSPGYFQINLLISELNHPEAVEYSFYIHVQDLN